MTAQIEEKVKNCWICCKYRRPHIEPIKSSSLPNLPWQKVATNAFVWKQKSYLLVIDYYFCYIEVAKLYSTTSDSVIEQLKEIFARHGIPQTIVSDNEPQYSSSQFREFSIKYKFKYVTSSPRYPQGNGEAERTVQIVKNLWKTSDDPHLALLSYNSTPINLGYSPAQLLMSRNIRSTVLLAADNLKPQVPKFLLVKQRDVKLKKKQKKYFNNDIKEQNYPLFIQEKVWIPDQDTRGTVQREEVPRSYRIVTNEGNEITRNCHHLRTLRRS